MQGFVYRESQNEPRVMPGSRADMVAQKSNATGLCVARRSPRVEYSITDRDIVQFHSPRGGLAEANEIALAVSPTAMFNALLAPQ